MSVSKQGNADLHTVESREYSQDPDVRITQYGWFNFRPGFLQGLLSSRWILVFCSFYVGLQGFAVTGLSGVVVSSIEKRYYLQSSQAGSIFSCYDAGNAIASILVSYLGYSHKSKWLGAGALVLSLGCMLFALPQLLVDEYEPRIASDLCNLNQTLPVSSMESCRNSKWYHMMVFVLGQLLIGVGGSPVYSLGSTFLDDNVTHKNSGIYLAIFYGFATLGPGLGFLIGGYFLSIYIDINLVRMTSAFNL